MHWNTLPFNLQPEFMALPVRSIVSCARSTICYVSESQSSAPLRIFSTICPPTSHISWFVGAMTISGGLVQDEAFHLQINCVFCAIQMTRYEHSGFQDEGKILSSKYSTKIVLYIFWFKTTPFSMTFSKQNWYTIIYPVRNSIFRCETKK